LAISADEDTFHQGRPVQGFSSAPGFFVRMQKGRRMTKEESNVASHSDVSEQPMDGRVTERRKRLADLIGHLLARKWLQQRRQTEAGNDPKDGGSK
jgi:hypothetical protein